MCVDIEADVQNVCFRCVCVQYNLSSTNMDMVISQIKQSKPLSP